MELHRSWEAAAQLDHDVKARFSDIEWARPAQLRNRAIHGYWSIDLEILHTTASDLLPGFVAQLRSAAFFEAADSRPKHSREESSRSRPNS